MSQMTPADNLLSNNYGMNISAKMKFWSLCNLTPILGVPKLRLKEVTDCIKSHSSLVWLDISTQYGLSNCEVWEGRLEKPQMKRYQRVKTVLFRK